MRHGAFALQNVDIDGRLEAGGRREDLALADGERRVALNDARAHAAQRLDAERQRRHIEQQKALHAAGQNARLQARAHGNALVGVDALERQRACHRLHQILHRRDAARTADHENLADLRNGYAGVVDGLIDRLARGLHEMVGQIVEFRACKRDLHMQRPLLADGDIRLLHGRLRHGRKLDLGLFGGLPHALHGGGVARQVDLRLLFELGDEIVDDALVKIVAAQMVVARRGQHLDHAGRDIENGHVERAAAEIIDHDLLRLLLIDAVGKGGCRRLVDDALDVQPRDLARVLRGLTLRVGKIGRDGDNRIGDRLAEKRLGVGLELLQDHRRDLLRGIFVPVDVHLVICAHLAFDGGDGALVVRDSLPLGQTADHALAGLRERHDRRSRPPTLRVGDDDRLAALHHRDTGIGRAEIDTDDLCHKLRPSKGQI